MQDECKGLSKFLASDPQARRHVRERCEEIKMGKFKDLNIRIQLAKAAVNDVIRMEGHKLISMDVVGSTYITDKPDSDIDVLCLVESLSSVSDMAFGGWAYGGSVGEGNEDHWGSWKRAIPGAGEVNMLVVTSKEYFNAWLSSAEVCRLLHLRGIVVPRGVSVSIHNILMDDSTADYEVSK